MTTIIAVNMAETRCGLLLVRYGDFRLGSDADRERDGGHRDHAQG